MCLPIPGNLLQVYGASSCNRGRRLAVSGAQPLARQTEVGVADSYLDQGGSGCTYIGTYLLGSGAISPAVWVRDMSTGAAYEEGVGQIPPQDGPQDGGTATAEGLVHRLGLPPYGGCDGGSGVAGMETSVSVHQNTVAKYIATRPIMYLCL